MLIISLKSLDWLSMYSTWPIEDHTNIIEIIVCHFVHPNEIHITVYTVQKQCCTSWFLISYYELLILTRICNQWPGVSILQLKNMNQSHWSCTHFGLFIHFVSHSMTDKYTFCQSFNDWQNIWRGQNEYGINGQSDSDPSDKKFNFIVCKIWILREFLSEIIVMRDELMPTAVLIQLSYSGWELCSLTWNETKKGSWEMIFSMLITLFWFDVPSLAGLANWLCRYCVITIVPPPPPPPPPPPITHHESQFFSPCNSIYHFWQTYIV